MRSSQVEAFFIAKEPSPSLFPTHTVKDNLRLFRFLFLFSLERRKKEGEAKVAIFHLLQKLKEERERRRGEVKSACSVQSDHRLQRHLSMRGGAGGGEGKTQDQTQDCPPSFLPSFLPLLGGGDL